jgi:type I restriction enzyme R subunit
MLHQNQLNEADTRYNLIDPQLVKAGWNLADRRSIGFEIPVDGYDAAPINGITDYCLYRENGEVLAVIEAKRTRRDAREGKEQLHQYLTKIGLRQNFRPFGFLTNGDNTWFWDSVQYPERPVAGFFTKEDLERLLFLQQNSLALSSIKIKENIVNRSYQVEAIRRISEHIERRKKRKALMVMATGTGKTRTTMALIDIFLRAKQAQRILFLADRDSLVDQAMTKGFKAFIPDESRERIRTYLLDDEKEATKIRGARILVSTLQTLELCFEKFSPAAFDLIVADECHRSIYNKFSDVLAYFDAVQIGLTATPAHFIDRNTFRFFETDGAAPTFLYKYDDAVKEGYLADYSVYAAQTRFQRQGIKGVDLPEEEQQSLRARGIDPDSINYEGTDLEKKVTNKDTLCKQWAEFMEMCHKDAGGQLPAKSIVFAITHKHALRLEETFNEMYPEHRGLLARVITSKTERAKDLLRQFENENLPRIAISVDMLDTGIDVPEVMNLAFMKPVNSQIKFWQMIGRGTRSDEACKNKQWLPGYKKENFLIIDYWQNFEHFNMMPKDGEEGPQQIPVLVGIFNTRLAKLELMLGDQNCADFTGTIADIRTDIAKLPLDSFTVKQHLPALRETFEDDWWKLMTATKIEFLRLKIGPLLRFAATGNLAEAFFISKMERLALNLLQQKDISGTNGNIKEEVDLLPRNLPQVAPCATLINDMIGDNWWEEITVKKLDDARKKLAPLMKYKREQPPLIIELGLYDVIESRKWVIVNKGGQKLMVEEYKQKVEAKIKELTDNHPTIKKLISKEAVTLDDLIDLERTLETELLSDDITLTEDNMLKAFGVRVGALTDFLKYVLKLEHLPDFKDVVRKAFDAFILEHRYDADQTRFLRTVQTVFVQKRRLEVADLYEAPFTNFGLNAVEKLFSDDEVEEIMELTKRLIA